MNSVRLDLVRRFLRVAPAALAALMVLMALAPLRAYALTDLELRQIEFTQYPGRPLPLDLPFIDDTGATVHLQDYFGNAADGAGKAGVKSGLIPVILVPGYFRCRMLCTGVTDGLLHALQGNRRTAGHGFRVVYVSIDPKEKLVDARERKRTWLKRYGRLGAEGGCAFLSGTPEAISQLCEQIGFHYRYDPVSGEFAHPAGFLVVRPDGRISRYFFGVNFSAGELEQALDAASQMQTGSAIRQFLLLCFHYNPIHSRYGLAIIWAVRLLALGTIAGFLWLLVRFKPASQPVEEQPGASSTVNPDSSVAP